MPWLTDTPREAVPVCCRRARNSSQQLPVLNTDQVAIVSVNIRALDREEHAIVLIEHTIVPLRESLVLGWNIIRRGGLLQETRQQTATKEAVHNVPWH